MHPKVVLTMFLLSQSGECRQRFRTSFQSLSVNSCHGAPSTALPYLKFNVMNTDSLQTIFLPGFQTSYNNVGAGAIHINWFFTTCFEALVQIIQWCLICEQVWRSLIIKRHGCSANFSTVVAMASPCDVLTVMIGWTQVQFPSGDTWKYLLPFQAKQQPRLHNLAVSTLQGPQVPPPWQL